MIQFDLKQKELDRALHDERERTIKKLVSDPEYFKRLSTDTGVRREVADALNAERKLSNLVWSLVRICYSGDAVKVVEAICQELPSTSRMVFLHNVVIVCRHPGSSLRNDPHGRRVAAFASGMRRHLSKQAPSSSYLKQLPTKKQVLRLIESCGSPGARLAVTLAAFSGLDRGQIRELVFQNLVEFSARAHHLVGFDAIF